jgi:hypothetical protein
MDLLIEQIAAPFSVTASRAADATDGGGPSA